MQDFYQKVKDRKIRPRAIIIPWIGQNIAAGLLLWILNSFEGFLHIGIIKTEKHLTFKHAFKKKLNLKK